MKWLCLLSGFSIAFALSCGGGGSADPSSVTVAQAIAPPMRLAFEEVWEPRTQETGVFGVVWIHPLIQTPDGSDPQQPWAVNTISGKWGTLAGLDGSVDGFPNATGLGPNACWAIADGRLAFHGEAVIAPGGGGTGGFALISRSTFSRQQRIIAEASITVTAKGEGGFAGLVLISGEGDYRQIAYRFEDGVLYVKRNTPLRETILIAAAAPSSVFRIEYDPVSGFRYIVDGVLVGIEALDHEGAAFAADPHVALYFAGESKVRGRSFVEGFVSPVRVWIGAKEPGNA